MSHQFSVIIVERHFFCPVNFYSSEKSFDTILLQKKALGQDLVKKVLMHLDLVEKDYFGLQFMDTKQVPVSLNLLNDY